MTILALDLGTKCGWAASVNDVRIGGTWKLTTEKQRKAAKEEDLDRRCDPRFAALLENIYNFRTSFGEPDLIIFEDVKFSEYTQQTQLWSSLRAAVWAWKYLRPNTQIQCLDTSSLKMWGAHHGGATKAMMGAWLAAKHPSLFEKHPKPTEYCFARWRDTLADIDDNQADAQHLLDYALANFS